MLCSADRSDPETSSIRRGWLNPCFTVCALLLAVACGQSADLLLLPGDGEPASIRVENDGQSGRVGEPLADSLWFVVSDSRTRPVSGARIVFDLSLVPGAEVVPDTAETDADGRAGVRMVLGTTIGDQVGQAKVLMAEGARVPTANFTVTALSENANGIAAVSGDEQTAPAGSTLGQPLVVRVTDAFDNPIRDVAISWSAEGGGTVSEASTVTDIDGRASVVRTLGPTAGIQTTLATSGQPLAGSPVIFTHTATAGSAAGLSIESGNEQTAQVGTELPGDLVVRLVDAAGNGVPGAGVTWVVGLGGGRVSPENTETDEAGRTATRWTLGPNPGENRVDAVVSGVGVVHFTATGTVSRPAALAILTQPSNSIRNGERLARQPVIQVRDGAGNPVAGVVVTAQLSGGGGELLGTRQLGSGADGRVTFTDLAIAGAEGTRRLVFTASGYAGVTSDVIGVRAIPTSTTITSDSPDPSVAGGAVTVTFAVGAEGVVPIGSVTVTDGSQSCTGDLSGGSGSCQLALNTVGTRTLRATYAGSAGLAGSSDTDDHQVTAPPAGNNPPVADYNWHCEQLTCAFTDASSDRDGSLIRWNWTFGDGGTSTVREPSHPYAVPGEYVVTLTVTDDDGASNTASAHVRVEAPPPPPNNRAPHAAFTVHCTGMTCTFEDQSQDDDGTIVSRSWNYDDGSPPSDVPSHTYSTPGEYRVTLTVTDNSGATDDKQHDAKAELPPPDNQPPQPEFTWSCSDLGCDFRDASTDDRGIASRSWTFGDPSSGDRNTSNSANPSHTFSGSGQYTVGLTVTDGSGESRSVIHTVDVTAAPPPDQPPSPNFTSSCNNLDCNFQDTSTDDHGITSRTWNFNDPASGDRNTSNSATPSHTFSGSGRFNVSLTVTDASGQSRTASQNVDVAAQPPPPASTTTSITGHSPDPSDPGQEITVSYTVGSASGTPTGNVRITDQNGGGCTGNAPSGSCSYTPNGTGPRTITATYDGNASYQASTATEQHTVTEPPPPPAGTNTSISSVAPEPSDPGATVTVSFTVTSGSGAPGGTVVVSDANGGGCQGNAPTGSCSYVPNGSGARGIAATYQGNSSFQSSTDSRQHTVNQPNTPPVAQIGADRTVTVIASSDTAGPANRISRRPSS